MNALVLDVHPEKGRWDRKKEILKQEIKPQQDMYHFSFPKGIWQKGNQQKLVRQISKLTVRHGVSFAALGDNLSGDKKGNQALKECGMNICNGRVLYPPLYPKAVRKLAKEAGINLMEQTVTVSGNETEIVEFIWKMKDEVRYFAVAGPQLYADLITYLYDEYGICVRLVEEAHTGICVAVGGEKERLSGELVLDFEGTDGKRIGAKADFGEWSQRISKIANESNFGAAEALFRLLGEEPAEAAEQYCRKISLFRKKPVQL